MNHEWINVCLIHKSKMSLLLKDYQSKATSTPPPSCFSIRPAGTKMAWTVRRTKRKEESNVEHFLQTFSYQNRTDRNSWE